MPIGPQGERLPYPGEPGFQGPPQGGAPAQPPMPGMGGGMAPQMPEPNPAVTDLETIRRMKDAEVAKLMGKPLHQAFSSTPPMTPPMAPPPQIPQQAPPMGMPPQGPPQQGPPQQMPPQGPPQQMPPQGPPQGRPQVPPRPPMMG